MNYDNLILVQTLFIPCEGYTKIGVSIHAFKFSRVSLDLIYFPDFKSSKYFPC